LQLEKEKGLVNKLEYRKERKIVAKSQFGAKSKQLAEITDAKRKHSEVLMNNLKEQQELQQTKAAASMLDEEVRLKQFQKQQELRNAEKSEKWKAKCKMMTLRKEEEDLKAEMKGQQQKEELIQKLGHIEEKQEEMLKAKKVRHQEESLRLVDAKDKIERLKRKDEFRRNLIRENMQQQDSRIDTLLKLKDQIVEQRKVRIKQSSCVKGRPQNIRSNTPGPGQYKLPDCLNEMPVPKISNANPVNLMPGSVDMMIKHSKVTPPPGSYEPQVLPNGNHLDWNVIDGGKTRLVKGDKKTFCDDAVKTYKHNPGPGTYQCSQSYELKHSVRMVRDYVDTSDKPPKWCKPLTDTPGPDEYVLDKFSKTGRAKSSSSAPMLGKALAMSSH
jgi:hypothetical protein